MGDLIALLVEHSLKKLAHALMLSMEVEAMVMEVCMSGNAEAYVHMSSLTGQSYSWARDNC